MNLKQTSILIALAIVWGASFLFIRVLVDAGIGPLGVSAARTGLGFACIAPVAWRLRKQLPADRRTIGALAILGFVNFALPWTLYAVAAPHAPTGAASIANSSTPLWSAIFATLLLKADRLGGMRILGLAVGFSGVLFLMGEGVANTRSSGAIAIVVMVCATLCYGLSAVSIRRFVSHVPAVGLAAAQIGFATLYLWPLALVQGAFAGAEMGAPEWGSLLALGCVGSGLAVVAYMWLIGEVGPVRASVVTYLMPPLGVFLGWLVLDETVGWNLAGGLALVITGVALVQGVPVRRLMLRAGMWPVAATAPTGD